MLNLTHSMHRMMLVVIGFSAYTFMHLNSEYSTQPPTLNPSDVTETDMASRSTELGRVRPQKAKSNRESSILKNIDPKLAANWGFSSINTIAAWQNHNAVGSRDIRVAVIDTGADIFHPDLKKNLWVNPGETGLDAFGRDKATNGIDDDGNGFVDDVHGWNFVGDNNDIADHHGHGTHIAGIIGAEGGNGIGISGVSPQVSLMILKYYDPKTQGVNNLSNTVRAIRYAIKMGAHIINYSGGGLEPSPSEKEAISLAQKKGILFVAAAGNERSNSDFKKYYPADYELDNIISVTAVDRSTSILPTSNYGSQSVDIAAPGGDIYSLLPMDKGGYGSMTGTSQATAFVTGAAAVIMAQHRDFDARRVVNHLTVTGQEIPPFMHGKTRFNRVLDLNRALQQHDFGTSANGAVTQNTLNLAPQTFSIEDADQGPVETLAVHQASPEFRGAGGFVAQSPDELASFGKAMQDLLLRKPAAPPQP